MYFRDIEESAQAKQDHDKAQKAASATRLKKNAEYNRTHNTKS